MPRIEKPASLLRTVTVRFPEPDPKAAFAPVQEAVSTDGFRYCIFCKGENATPTSPGVLRCSEHANVCIDRDCRAPFRRPKYEKETECLSFKDASGSELLCDDCRGAFFRKLAYTDDRDYAKKGIPRDFFVYRYAAPHGRDYGMTYCPTLRRQQRAQGRTAGPIEHEVLSFLDFDHEEKFKRRAGTIDWLSPSFEHRSQAYQLECMIKHFELLGRDQQNGYHPNSELAREWGARVLRTSGFVPLESATITFDPKLSRPHAPLDPYPETTLTLIATVQPTGRAGLGPAAFTAQTAKITGKWCPSTDRQVVGGRAETAYEWNLSTSGHQLPVAVLEFAGDALAIPNSPLEVPMDGGPGWLSDLRWLPLRLALRVHSPLLPCLSSWSGVSEPVMEPDDQLARGILEWANTETGSRVHDFGESAVAFRLLDAFGAFPATRMIALAHALDGRRGRYSGRARGKQDGATATSGAAWYRRAAQLGDPIALVMEERRYDELNARPTYDDDEWVSEEPCIELPMTKAARQRAKEFAYATASSPTKRFRIVVDTGRYTRGSGPESKRVKARRA